MRPPRALISYAWEDNAHRDWVRELATRLRAGGVEAILDQWHAVPGDQLPEFMERGVRENDYVLIVCTPKYKQRSDNRTGGVGYEGDIISAEVFTTRNHRKFIPLLRRGEWAEAAPSVLGGKIYIDLRGGPYSEDHFGDLLATLLGQRNQAPPVGHIPAMGSTERQHMPEIDDWPGAPPDADFHVVITGVVVDEITVPASDGTRGSGLYAIPFQLSGWPGDEWASVFVQTWNDPPNTTTMHRPGIARVEGDRVILDGTTIEEVEQYHRDTLRLIVPVVNGSVAALIEARKVQAEEEATRIRQHERSVREAAKRITF